MQQILTTQLHTQSLDDAGKFAGYGSVFNVRDGKAITIEQGAFSKSLSKWKQKNALPPVLWQHKHDEPIGVYTRMEENSKGLYVEGQLLINDDPMAKRVYSHLKAGTVNGLSVGFTVVDKREEGEHFEENEVITEANLWEVSLVTFPANEQARVHTVQKALTRGEQPTKVEVERALREVGFSIRQAKAIIAKGYDGLNLREANEAIEQSKVNNLINLLKGKYYA